MENSLKINSVECYVLAYVNNKQQTTEMYFCSLKAIISCKKNLYLANAFTGDFSNL